MTNTHSVSSFTKTALVAALMSGSSLALAQEAPVVTSVPEPVAQVEAPPASETIVAPPPLVRTLPSQNDVVNPAALQQAEEERQAKATPAPAARTKAPARQSAASAQRQPVVPQSTDPVADAPTFNEPNVLPEIPAAPAAIEATPSADTLEAAPVASTPDGSVENDLPLFAGIAAALAALGLSGLFVARRRSVATPQPPRMNTTHVAPHVLQQAPAPTTVQTPIAPQTATQQPRVRETIDSRPDVPVTDPLFSTPVVAGPITDPMFAPRNDVQTPITDPLFAKHHDFAGRLRDTRPTPTPETV